MKNKLETYFFLVPVKMRYSRVPVGKSHHDIKSGEGKHNVEEGPGVCHTVFLIVPDFVVVVVVAVSAASF